jgi:serine phosphatase RsbU (regulator of sigma subunit)
LISEITLQPGLCALIFTDGLVHAGERYGNSMDIATCLEVLLDDEDPTPESIAESLLEHALKLDQDRPADDISIAVLRVTSHPGDLIRRMYLRLPLDS